MTELRAALPRAAAIIQQGIDEGLHLGAQVFVSVDGKVVADGALGEARAGAPMTRDSMITWFSMTKPSTAVSIAQQWERGQLDLDDPIARYVPEFAQHGKGAITIRHCLTHTAGFRSADAVQSDERDPDRWWDAVIAATCAVEPEDGWVPGEKAGYHLTAGMTMLAEVVRRVDGRPFPQYVREEVFLPLGMDDCWVGMPREKAEEYGERLGTMHYTEHGPAVALGALDSRTFLSRCVPGGGGRGPMRQLARLYECLVAGGEREGVRILRPQTVEAITARHRVAMFDETFGIVTDWGLGFAVDSGAMGRHCSRRAFGHGGAQSSLGFADPERGLVAVFQTNGMCGTSRHYVRMSSISSAIYEDAGLASPDDPGREKPLPVSG